MANEPVWLTADHLIEFNELEVAVTGDVSEHYLIEVLGEWVKPT